MTQPSHRTSLRAESPTYVGINEQMTMDELKSSCGNTGSANQDLRRFQLLSQTRFVTSYGRALVYAGLDDREQTLLCLRNAVEERSHWMVWSRLDPRFNKFRADQRFQDVVQQVFSKKKSH